MKRAFILSVMAILFSVSNVFAQRSGGFTAAVNASFTSENRYGFEVGYELYDIGLDINAELSFGKRCIKGQSFTAPTFHIGADYTLVYLGRLQVFGGAFIGFTKSKHSYETEDKYGYARVEVKSTALSLGLRSGLKLDITDRTFAKLSTGLISFGTGDGTKVKAIVNVAFGYRF